MGLRVGIGLFTAQLPANSKRTFEQEYRETLELVRLAEGVGFDSAWVSEHHGSSDWISRPPRGPSSSSPPR